MGAQDRQDRLASLLVPVLAEAGLDLEDVEVVPAGKRRLLRVIVDSDEGVDLDAVGEISRQVSEALDGSDAMGKAPYVLEVSSPGVDRMLTLPRHWRRSRGRLVKAHRTDGGGEVTGRVADASDTGVTLEGEDGARVEYPYAALERAKVQVEFRRPDDGTAAAD